MSPVSMDDLLQPTDSTPPKIVVVQGVPGIGKSTFAWKFCRRWAKGKNYQEYELVVLLRMRDTRIREAKKLTDLFFSEDEESSKQIAKDIIARDGKNILILLEGIDELPASCLADGTVLSDLLQGLSLPEVTIVLTTRPWAVQVLNEKCGDQFSRLVEILGFTKEDIQSYVSHVFTDSKRLSTDFLEYLHSHPQLESIMHIPLNAAILVQIYKQFKCSQQAIPHTLTQLYISLVKGHLIRYMKSEPEFSQLRLMTLESLPEPIKTHFEHLCLLAFMSFTKVNIQVTFTDSEAALYGCLDSLGLMQSSADLSIDTGTTVTHSFLHFTIQEFLAAYHLSNQQAQVQELFLETHQSDSRFHMLINFLFGLNSSIAHNFVPSVDMSKCIRQIHWFFEAQSPKALLNYFGTVRVRYVSLNATSFDLYALSYCLCHSKCTWKITASLSSLSSLYHIKTDYPCKGEINSLTLTAVTCSALEIFFSLPKALFSKLERLEITSKEDIDCVVAGILKSGLLPCTHLRQFGLRNLGVQFSVTATVDTLCTLFPRLNAIGLVNSLVTSSDMTRICQYITSSKCSPRFELVLNRNVFLEDSLQILISAIACCKSLDTLYLSHIGNQLSLTNIEMLSIALSTNTSLTTLKLYSCSITGEGAEVLASGLEENKALAELDLCSNDIDKTGATAIATMLEQNISLKKLNLANNKLIRTDGALRLINALEQNKTLEKLHLPLESEPIEYGSILLEHIREQNRILFL